MIKKLWKMFFELKNIKFYYYYKIALDIFKGYWIYLIFLQLSYLATILRAPSTFSVGSVISASNIIVFYFLAKPFLAWNSLYARINEADYLPFSLSSEALI